MMKYLLALLFTFATFAAPVTAACTLMSTDGDSCCCCSMPVNEVCAELSSACCSSDGSLPSAPSQQLTQEASPISAQTPAAVVSFAAADNHVQPAVQAAYRPLHLATNKLYLLKRTLLI